MISKRKEHGYDDFIIRELERIGLLIRAILEKEWNKIKPIEIVNDMCDDLPFSDEELLKASKDELKEMLTPEKGFNAVNIELLGDVFAKVESERRYLQTALFLYKVAEEQSAAFSFTLHPKIETLEQRLQNE